MSANETGVLGDGQGRPEPGNHLDGKGGSGGRPTLTEVRDRATLTIPETGTLLGLGRSAAYEAARNGDLPTIRVGRRVVVPVPALLKLLGAEQ